MASYRPFPPPSNQNPIQQRGNHHQNNWRGGYVQPTTATTSSAAVVAGREFEHSNHNIAHKQHKHAAAPAPVQKSNGPPPRRVETEEEKRLRKKRELEKQRQEENHRQQLKESQNNVLQKTQILCSGKGHGSIAGSRMGERRATPLLSGERVENRLKKPTTFLCKLKFRNELPDPTAQPKLMAFKKDKDQYAKYTITSLEKMYKPKLFVEPDLGIPLDLLDLSVYNPPSVRPPLAPEDEALLRDDEAVTPIKKDGIKRKERPTDKGVAWLVKTQYISPLSMESTKQSLTEKQAKELREMKGGRNILENLNNRERQIREIEASFEAAKSHPVHAANKELYPVEVMPLLPDFDRYDDQFVVAAFDNAPTADSEMYTKLDKSVRDVYESRAVMKSYVATSSDPANPEKFLAYMAPAPGELSKDIYDENEEVSYSWVREYHWDVRGDDADDPTTFLVSFDELEARYLPLPTKLVLRKKRAKEGRSGDEVEQFPIPSRVTLRRSSSVAAIERKDSGGNSSRRGGIEMDGGLEHRHHRVARHQDNYHSSGAEDYMSD
ncbi:RNA polymerase II associated factor Paf1 [Sesbania bispinosa]|nr:RNA polymerase II associated factor Paf1 [Sesbania bispinosa]